MIKFGLRFILSPFCCFNPVFLSLRSLEKALGWTVTIIEVSSSKRGAAESRTLRADVETLVSFIAVDEGEAVSFEDVKE